MPPSQATANRVTLPAMADAPPVPAAILTDTPATPATPAAPAAPAEPAEPTVEVKTSVELALEAIAERRLAAEVQGFRSGSVNPAEIAFLDKLEGILQ